MGRHLSADRTLKLIVLNWWWEGMYQDIARFVSGYPERALVSGGGRVIKPPLCPILVQRPFQIVGVDITPMHLIKVEDYQKELILSLSSARELAAASTWSAKKRYKNYDSKTSGRHYHEGD